jgi:fibronectin-binding autotransporter adhesin
MRTKNRKPALSHLAVAIAAAFVNSASYAQAPPDHTWTGGTGNWATGANWDQGAAPGTNNKALINNGGTAQVQAAGAVASSFLVGNAAGLSGTVEIAAGGTLTASGNTTSSAGATGTGSLVVEGTLSFTNANGILAVGANNGGSGTATVRNGGTINGGFDLLRIGIGAGSTGTVTITGAGSTISAVTAARAGEGGTGTLNLAAGGKLTLDAGGSFSIGADGTLNIGTGAGAGVLDTAGANITGSGTVNFNHTNANYVFTSTGANGGTAQVIAGTNKVRHTGTGTTTLTGANTYTGGTTVTAGTLVQGAAGAFVGNSAYTVDGGTLSLNNFNLTASSLSGTGGTVSLGTAALTVNQTTNTTYSGVISGTGSLTKSGTGTLTLSGANTYSGGTTVTNGTLTQGAAGGFVANGSYTVNGGTLSLNNINFTSGAFSGTGGFVNLGTATLTVDQSTNTSYTGGIFGTGSLVKSGTGSLTLSGENTYSGDTTVTAGTLVRGSALAFSANRNWTVNGGTLSLNNLALTMSSLAGSGGTVSLGTAALTVNQSANTSYAGAITGTSSLTKSGAGTLTLTGANTYSGGTTVGAGTLSGTTTSLQGAIVNNATVNFDQSTSGTYAGVMSGTGALTKAGTGTVTLTGANTYSGGTTVSAGTLSGTTTSLQGAISNNATVNFDQAAAGTYAGVMSGTGVLTKSGAGTTTLTGANTYTGGTTVTAGTLVQGAAGAFVGNTGYTVDGGTLSMNNFDLTASSLSGTGGTVSLGTAALTVNQSTDTTYAGVISGTGSLTKSGTGTLTLTGANTYSGGTTLGAGTLAGTSSSLQGAIVNNATVNFDQSTSGAYAGVMSGTGALTKSGAGTLTLTGANTYSGGTTVAAGTLSGTTTSLQGAIVNNATVNFDQGTAGSYAGAMSGTGALTKSGAGTVTLTGANTYSGGTTVNAGTLGGTTTSLQGAIVNNATVNFDQGTAGTYAGVMSGTGVLTKSGAGTLTLAGANTYSGGTTVSAGTLAGTSTSLQGAIVNNAAVAFDQASSGTYAGVMSGTGTLTKAGAGTLSLTGANTYTGATTINAGTLAVNGSLASPVTVNSGGTLGGTGTINNTVAVASGGVFAPGNSIGTTVVNGSATFAAGSTYRVEVDAAGNSDRISVTGNPGRATINGGTVDVQAPSTVQRNTTYSILDATGGVTGTFSAVTTNLVFLTPSLGYGPNSVQLTLGRNAVTLASVAITRNQLAVASYLDFLGGTDAVVRQFDGLNADQARAGFSSVGGDGLSAFAHVATADAHRFMRLINARSSPEATGLAATGPQLASAGLAGDLPAVYAQAGTRPGSARGGGERGFWLLGSASRGNMDGDGNGVGFDWRGGSIAAGFDAEVGRGTVLGGALSYGRADVSLDAGSGSGRVKSPRFALYGSHVAGRWQFKGSAGYANHDIDTRRNVAIGAATSVATGSHQGREVSAGAEAQYAIAFGGGHVKPFAGLGYVRLREAGFTESGSAANLAVNGRSTESIVSQLGARYTRLFNAGSGAFELRASLNHEFGDANPGLNGRLAAAAGGATFTVAGVPVKRDALVLGAGVSNEVRKNLSVRADVNTELRGGGQSQHALALGLRYEW